MGEPRAITYKQVESAGGNAETWAKIGKITGAGEVPRDAKGNATIDLTGATESELKRVDALLADAEAANKEAKAAADKKTTK